MNDDARLDEIRDVAAQVAALLKETPIERGEPAAPRRYSNAYEAAALLSRFRSSDLAAYGASAEAIGEVIADCVSITGLLTRNSWTLTPSVRANVLRQIAGENRLAETIRDIEAKIVGASEDALCRSMEQLTRSGKAALQDLSPGDLAVVAPVLELMEGTIANFPDREDAERRLGLIRLLQPFERLVGTHFRGRRKELDRLRAYVDVLESGSKFSAALAAVAAVFSTIKKRPFLVYGVGGVGKSTLIAKFILDHTKGADFRFPFAYLDYDRRAVMVDEPATILIEAVRQFGLQYPDAQSAAAHLAQSWRALIARAAPANAPGEAVNPNSPLYNEILTARERIRDEFVSFLNTMRVDPDLPVLLVLDTFEEMQYRSRAYVEGVKRFLDELREQIPRLRIVLVGRAAVSEFEVEDDPIELGEFDLESATGFLAANGVADSEVAKAIYNRVSGNPLSLRLALEVFRLEGIAGITSLARKANIQGQLFERILDHIHHPDVRKIAHPGLVLRRVTADLIRDVLAGPCDLGAVDQVRAAELFDELKREVALVSSVDPDVVTHLSYVRKVMLGALRDAEPEKVEQIHNNAVAYYAQYENDPVARAEEIYHRLSLRQDPAAVDARFPPEMTPAFRKFLGDAVDELAPPEQAYLAERLGLQIPPEAQAAASQEVWERAAERTLDEYLRQRNYDAALQLLAERKDRSARTMVRVREAMVYLGLNDLANADKIVTDAIKAYNFGGNNRALFEALMVAVDVAQQLEIFDEARQQLARAEKIAVDERDDVRLVRVLVGRCVLRDLQDLQPEEDVLQQLSAVAHRVSDTAWLNDPPLLRLVATLAGDRDPALLAKAFLFAPPSRLSPDRQRLIEVILQDENIEIGERISETLARVLSAPSPSPTVIAVAGEWLRSEVGPIADDATKARARRRKSAVRREDVGPLLAALHLQREEISSIIEHSLHRSLASISFADDGDTVLRDVLDAAEREHWLPEFLDSVRLAHRDTPLLLALDGMGMGLSISDSGSLRNDRIAAQLAAHRPRVAQLQHATCRIEEGTNLRGTGLLVGEDRVLTTVGALPAAPATPATVRFDYGEVGGTSYNAGAAVRARQHLVLGEGKQKQTPVAVIVERAVGRELIGGDRSIPTAFQRTWIDPDEATSVAVGAEVFWLWHSSGKMEITGARIASIGESEIVLDTKGRPEQIGAPCFDEEFRLIGTHAGPHPALRNRTLVIPIWKSNALYSVHARLWFVDSEPVIGRGRLRETLLAMLGEDGPRVLTVNGPPQSGKSFTARIIQHLGERLGFDVRVIDFESLTGLSAYHLGATFTEMIGTRARMTWIVIDGFEQAGIDPEAREFLRDLMQRIAVDWMDLRLVLIGYKDAVPLSLENRVAIDMTDSFSFADIEDFFRQLYRERWPEMTTAQVEARVTMAMRYVIGRVPVPELSRAIADVVKTETSSSPSAPESQNGPDSR